MVASEDETGGRADEPAPVDPPELELDPPELWWVGLSLMALGAAMLGTEEGAVLCM